MIFGSRRKVKEKPSDRPRYISSLQKDVCKYNGWTRKEVEDNFCVNKSVHTILTIGYMEYDNSDTLVLTEKGRMLMRNVPMAASD